MVHYKFKCEGWTEGKKVAFGLKLSSELGIFFGYENSLVDATKPYIEVDRSDSGVAIRRMTNLTSEQQTKVVKVASEWYSIFEKIAENVIGNEIDSDIVYSQNETQIMMNELINRGFFQVYVKWICGKCGKIVMCNEPNKFFLEGYIHENCGYRTYPNKFGITVKPNEEHTFTDEDFFKGLGITENDRLKNYQLVKSYWNSKMSKLNDVEDLIAKEQMDLLRIYWKSSFKQSMDEAQLFVIEDDAIPMILHTECNDGKLPFNSVFIDAKVKIKNRNYFGFHVGSYYTEKAQYKAILTVYSKEIQHGDKMVKVLVPDFILLKQDKDENLPFRKSDYYHNKIRNFVFSFCSFINEPEVSVHTIPCNPKNNERRVARGIMPLPEYKNVVIRGKLRIYVDEIARNLNSGTRKSIGYRYWVRGFYRHFFNTKRYAKLYALDSESQAKAGLTFSDKHNGILRRWIKPSIRGQGILIKQSWEVKE